MISKTQFDAAADWLLRSKRPLLVSHRRPDGDAIGSLAAMTALVRQFGGEPRAVLFEAFPARYALLQSAAEWQLWSASAEQLQAACDSVIVLDTCSFSQLEPIAHFLRAAPRTLVIDHHATSDPLAQRDGDLRLIDSSAGATALLLVELHRALRIAVTPTAATALFVGLATDSGWFRFSNTDARLLGAAAAMLDAGADANRIHAALYQQDAVAKLRLVARVLTSLELHAGGRLATLFLRREDFRVTGADRSMTEDLVNEASRLAGIECTLLFSEEEGDEIRVNLRSRERLDVAALAATHGGGGHARAAGCRLSGAWEVTVRAFVQEAERALL